jgi:hypothetical protein
MQFHRDTWVLDGYLDEAGWDGQHQLIYFSTRRDATAMGEHLARRLRGYRNGIGFQFEVYRIVPEASFFGRETELEKMAKELAKEWRDG